jgi:hypothetical protein
MNSDKDGHENGIGIINNCEVFSHKSIPVQKTNIIDNICSLKHVLMEFRK